MVTPYEPNSGTAATRPVWEVAYLVHKGNAQIVQRLRRVRRHFQGVLEGAYRLENLAL